MRVTKGHIVLIQNSIFTVQLYLVVFLSEDLWFEIKYVDALMNYESSILL